MNIRLTLFAAFIALTLLGCGAAEDHEHEDDHATAEQVTRGPHGGRLLQQGSHALELAIFEDGVPPQYRAWLYKDGKLLPPSAGTVHVTLARLGKPVEEHTFAAEAGYLRSAATVYEPHSFDVAVQAQIEGQQAAWKFASYEGRTQIVAAVAQQSGIRTAAAGAGVIRDEHEVQGLLIPAEGRYARIVARFPGPVRAIRAGVGDVVTAGQVLATVESNVSLSDYAVTAPFAGTVLARNAAVGDLAGSQPLFEIADLSTLWVDLHLFGGDAEHIRAGLPVVVTRLSDGVSQQTRLDRILPGAATASQSTVARATLRNSQGDWRPGTAVRARVTVAEQQVPLLVPLAALQSFRDWDVVFMRSGETYEVRPLELGRRDNVNVEVLAGLQAGDDVVVEQSYLIKADIEKAGASHDH